MAPPLSIAIGTTQPWPGAKAVLDSVYGQARRMGAEVVLAVSAVAGRPPAHLYPGLRIVEVPSASVFELRESAIAASSGEIVAVTEDHCVAAGDWCERIVEAHTQRPEADVIGGAVRNGSPDPLGWAAFLISNAPSLPPVQSGERSIVTGHANASFKRHALWGWGAGGLDDGRYREALRRRGGHLFMDGRIEVVHIQSFPPLVMGVYLFHGGRALAGHQRAHLSGWRWTLRLIKVLLLPVRVLVNTFRIPWRAATLSPEYRKPALLCTPWLALLLIFYYSGELTGHLFGPRHSPHRLY